MFEMKIKRCLKKSRETGNEKALNNALRVFLVVCKTVFVFFLILVDEESTFIKYF